MLLVVKLLLNIESTKIYTLIYLSILQLILLIISIEVDRYERVFARKTAWNALNLCN